MDAGNLASRRLDGNAVGAHAALVTIDLARLTATDAPFAAALTAAAVAVAGGLLVRRRPLWVPGVAAAAALVGWGVLAGITARSVISPRLPAESLVGAAGMLLVGALLGLRWRSRWVGAAAAMLAAWWLAGTPAARPEYWRVLFGALAAAWLLRGTGGGEPRRAWAVGAAVWGASALAGAPAAAGLALVLATVAAGLWLTTPGGAIPAGLSMLALAGAEVGAGRALRGGIGVVDLACLGALAAPASIAAVERALQRRTRRGAGFVAPALVAGFVAGAAWIGARLLRGHHG